MQVINFDRSQDIPIIDAVISGPITHERVRLVFDSGCGLTQIDTGLMESIGYSVAHAKRVMSVKGPVGNEVQGYVVGLDRLNLFGFLISNLEVGVYDFDNFAHYGIDGLLGFDLIKQMHFELNGPQGLLKVCGISIK